MRKLCGLFLVAALSLFAGASVTFGQQNGSVLGNGNISHRGDGPGTFYAPGYSTWSAAILSGNTSTGAGVSITVMPLGGGASGIVLLQDGAGIPLATIFNTSVPIRINDANAETVTPTGVSYGTCPAGFLGVGGVSQCATITGTFNNTHGASASPIVFSGDGGIEEAITDAQNQGGGVVYWEADCGNVTLNTGGVTTTTSNCAVPLFYMSLAGSAIVKTTITVATSFSLGTTTTTTSFLNGCTNLTAGLNCLTFNSAPTKVAGATTALTPVLITAAGGTPGAGVVHVKAFGYTPVQSAQ